MKSFASTLTLLFFAATAVAGNSNPAKNIVIVHGAFADGSGWEGVSRILTQDGYHVTIVQNSTASLAGDVTATENALAAQDGPTVLVGHSYGGEVITQAGNDPKVQSLVYVAAFVPDVGESLMSLNTRVGAYQDPKIPSPPIGPSGAGFLALDREKFPEAFAADVDATSAQFMAASQVPLGLQAFTDKITVAAWKTKPSFYIISSDDHMIPPAAEKMMATRAHAVEQFEIKASHAVYVSQPAEVAKVIERAATQL
jgi:pimeloyl-ACP methyl ester carboxylesterase